MRHRSVGLLVVCIALSQWQGCGKSNGDSSQAAASNDVNGGSGESATGAHIKTALKVHQQSSTRSAERTSSPGTRSAVTTMTDARGSDLQRLEYYILNVTICQSMEVNGSGFNNPVNCIDLYKGPTDPMLNSPDFHGATTPDYAGLANYARTLDATSGYIDLMSADSRAKLASEVALTFNMAGDYQYGLVSWAYPIRLQATLRDANGEATLFTQDGSTYVNDNGYPYTVAAKSFTEGPSEVATVPLGNGGSWFKFQAPFTIDQNDIATGKGYALDLTFNPDGLVYGFNAVPQAQGGIYEDAQPDGTTALNAIQVPFLDLTPVPHESDDVVMKETYMGTVTTGTDARMDVRIELYSLQDDPTRTIYGVSTAGLVNADSFGSNLPVGKAAFISAAADGSVTLEDWGHHPFLTGLARQTQVGGTTTVTMSCTASGSISPLYGNCTDTFPLQLTLTALTPLD